MPNRSISAAENVWTLWKSSARRSAENFVVTDAASRAAAMFTAQATTESATIATAMPATSPARPSPTPLSIIVPSIDGIAICATDAITTNATTVATYRPPTLIREKISFMAAESTTGAAWPARAVVRPTPS